MSPGPMARTCCGGLPIGARTGVRRGVVAPHRSRDEVRWGAVRREQGRLGARLGPGCPFPLRFRFVRHSSLPSPTPPSTSSRVAAMPPSPQTPPGGRPDPLTAATSPAICPLWAASGRRCGCTRPPVESPRCGPATPAGGGRQLSRSAAASFTLLTVAVFLRFGLLVHIFGSEIHLMYRSHDSPYAMVDGTTMGTTT